MAQSELGIILSLDAKDFVNEINSATKETKELQKDLNKINKQLKFDPKNVDLLNSKLEILKKQYTEVSKNFERYNKILKEMNESIANGNTNLTKSDKRYIETARNVSIFGKQLESLKSQIVEVSDTLGVHDEDYEKYAKDVARANNEIGESSEKALAKAVAMGDLMASAIKAVAKEVVKLAKDVVNTNMVFEDSVQHLKALYGSTADGIDDLDEEIAKLAVNSYFTPEQIASAMNSMAKAGYSAEDSLTAVTTVMQMAAVSGEDTVSVSETLMATLAAFGGTAEDAARYAGVLASAANETLVDIKDLSESFEIAAPIAGTFGYEVEDIAGALALMSQQGIKGSQAGTTLRSIMQRLATDTGKANTTLMKYGDGFYDLEGNVRPFVDVLNSIRDAYNQIDSEQEKANLLNKIGGKTGLSGLSALVNTSKEDWDSLMETIMNSGTYIEDTVQVQYDSLAGDIQKLKANWDVFKINLGGEAVEPIRDVVKMINDLMSNEEFMNEVKDWGSTLAETADTLKTFAEIIAVPAAPIIQGFGRAIQAAVNTLNVVVRLLSGKSLTEHQQKWLQEEKEYGAKQQALFDAYDGSSGGAGIANAILSGGTSNSLSLTTQIYVNNNGTPINEAEIRRWGDTITNIVSSNLGRRLA